MKKNEGGAVLDGETEITSVKLLKREYKTLTIRPEEGFHIESMTVNGNAAEVSDPAGFNYIVKLIIENVGIQVTFAKDEEPAVPANKTELLAFYTEKEGIQQDGYTEESWQKFQEQMEKAKTVLDKETASQEEVDRVLQNLQEAFAQLAKVDENKTQLEVTEDPTVPNTTITGNFAPGAYLVVQPVEPGGDFTEMSAQVPEGFESIGIYEVYVVGEKSGSFTLTFETGIQYNGRNAIVYHKKADTTIEQFNMVVTDGKVTITTDSLSPFMIVLEKSGIEPEKPSEPGTPSDPGGTPGTGTPSNPGGTSGTGTPSNPGGTSGTGTPSNPGGTSGSDILSNPNAMVKVDSPINEETGSQSYMDNGKKEAVQEAVKTGDENKFAVPVMINVFALLMSIFALYYRKKKSTD